MRAVAAAGLEAWEPSALIFDFSELDYVWGDMLQGVLGAGRGKVHWVHLVSSESISEGFDFKNGDLPTLVVVSDRCRIAVRSLIEQEMSEDPEKWMFDSLEAAISAMPQPRW